MQIVSAPDDGSWVVIQTWTGLAHRYAVLNLRTEEHFDCTDRGEAEREAQPRNDIAATQPACKYLLNPEHKHWYGTRALHDF
jgi:hypothetical protein